MLTDSLFRIVNYQLIPDDATGSFRMIANVTINASHDIFLGHFPGNPVVPGVCLVQILMSLLESVRQHKVYLSEAEYIKFLQIINPFINNMLRYDMLVNKLDSEFIFVNCTLYSDTVISMKLKGKFGIQTS